MYKAIRTAILGLLAIIFPIISSAQMIGAQSDPDEIRRSIEQARTDGATIYVASDGDDIAGDGSQSDPFGSIQHAIDEAADGNTILVMPGTYEENINFSGKDIIVTSSDGPEVTIIQAIPPEMGSTETGPCVTFATGETRDAIFNGFTVTGSSLAGIQCVGTSPTILNNIIKENSSHESLKGAGVNLFNTNGALVKGNVFQDNQTTKHGSAIHVLNGGADTICYNLAINNLGFFVFACVNSNVVILNNTIHYADFYGVSVQTSGHVTLYNNIVQGATAQAYYSENPALVTAGYNCDWQCTSGGYLSIDPGEGAISGDPLFVDPINGNFNLQEGSPCIDAGNPDPDFNDYDGSRNDMGAKPLILDPPLAMDLNFGADALGSVVINAHPNLWWTYFDTVLSTQVACEVEVGTDDDWTEAELWSSGQVIRGITSIQYGGPDLEDNHTYFLRIRLYNGEHWGTWLQKEFLVLLTDDLIVPHMFASIQGAIDYALDGDRIMVYPETYIENLNFRGKDVAVISSKGAASTFLQPENTSTPTVVFNNGEGPDARLEGFTVENGGLISTVIVGNGSQPNIAHNIFRNNIPGAAASQTVIWVSGSASISYNLFYENGGDACIHATGTSSVINNTIYNNAGGVNSSDVGARAMNNIVVGNANYSFSGTFVKSYNDDWGNGSTSNPGIGGISVDPLFVDAENHDFHLSLESPCVNAGNPEEAYNDIDGTRNDMGAFPVELAMPYARDINFGPEAEEHFVTSLTPEFHWTFFDTLATTQNAYQIQVGSDNDWEAVELWDSGPVSSSEGFCLYDGSPLADNTIFFGRLKVDNGSNWGDWVYFWFEVAIPSVINVPQDYTTIQAAINAAHEYDSVLVAPGTYSQNVDFTGKDIVLASTDGPGVTTIVAVDESSPSPDKSDVYTKGHCVSFIGGESRRAVLSGFTLTGSESGAIRSVNSSPTIQNNIIKENSSYKIDFAAAITLSNSHGALIRNNTIFSNHSAYVNTAVFIKSGLQDTVCYNTIYDNTGGAALKFTFSQEAAVFNNTIYNSATNGINFIESGVDVRNNIISLASQYGLYSDATSTVTSDYNCLNDCIDGQYYQVAGGENDIGSVPLFSDIGSRDFHLESISPCIDAGDPDPFYNDPDGTRNDMGSAPIIRLLPYPMDFNFGPNAMGHAITENVLEFYWVYFDTLTVTQDRYQIQIGTDTLWDEAETWDSGPVQSDNNHVIYDGNALIAFVKYYIRLRDGSVDNWGGWNQSWFTVVTEGNILVPYGYATISEAIANAESGDVIQVGPGVYTENINYSGKNIKIISTNGPSQTFIRPANLGASTVTFYNGENNGAVLSGFTIENGGPIYTVKIGNGAKPIIEYNIFRNNISGVINPLTVIQANGQAIIRYNLFYGNGGINTIWSASAASITNNTIVNNTRGVYSTSSATVMQNNIVVNNNGYGILGDFASLDYNDAWGNGSDNNPGTNGISENPLFSNPGEFDFSLSESSPCIDAGNPVSYYNDRDGSRNDMGCFPRLLEPPFAIDMNFGPESSGNVVVGLTPEIDWTFFDTLETAQAQYHIQVGTDNDWTVAEMWDTGPVESSDNSILYNGSQLSYLVPYYLRIRLNNGQEWGKWVAAVFICAETEITVPGIYPTIAEAINSSQDFDTILVAPGIYTENIQFGGKNVVLKSIVGAEQTTIQSGTFNIPVVTFDDGESEQAVLEGFTIMGATGVAGIRCQNSDPTIQDCIIRDNNESDDGGGIICINSRAMIRNNRIFNNSCTKTGAGIAGSGSVCPTIEYNEIYENTSSHGVGIGFVQSTSGLTIHHNLIRNNSGSGEYAAGIYINGNNSVIYNNTIVNNSKGIQILSGNNVDVRNNIIVSNSGPGLSLSSATFDYNDAWNNGSNNLTGDHGISANPQFKNAAANDYTLQLTSPCINAGDPKAQYNDPDGSANDMGAFYVPFGLPLPSEFSVGPHLIDNVVSSLTPVFNWVYFDTLETSQAMYEIQVGSDNDWEAAELWDTGPVSSNETSVTYNGQPLTNRDLYYVRVRVSDGENWGAWIIRSFIPAISKRINVPANFTAIQEAINASLPYDTVLVAPGSYTENLDFGGHNVVVMSSSGPENTFIKPSAVNSTTVTFNTGEDQGSILHGFTIENGGSAVTMFIGITSHPTIEYNVFRNNIPNVTNPLTVIRAEGKPLIRYNLFYNNAGINTIWTTGEALILNNTIVNNARGIYGQGYNATILNNIVANNTEYGVLGEFRSVDYNDVWSNGSNNSPGANGISSDPQFINPGAGDYHLAFGSPCVNAGDPEEVYNDPDGSRNDIGAYPVNYELPYAMAFQAGPSLGLDDYVSSLTPEFSWEFYDNSPTVQAMFQIQVGIDTDWETADVWDPGPIESDQNTIVYAGPDLADRTRYFARIRLNNGEKWGDWTQSLAFTPVISHTIIVPDNSASIQAAIDQTLPHDTVLVMPGTYSENINFLGRSIRVVSSAGSESTILQPAVTTQPIVIMSNVKDTAAVLDGFTLRNASNNVAIYAHDGDPVISNCEIRNCTYGSDGAGIFLDNSAGVIRHNTFHDNTSETYGSAILAIGAHRSMSLTVTGNFIYENSAVYAGPVLIMDVSNCFLSYNLVYDNQASDDEIVGGLVLYACDDGLVFNNTVYNNSGGIIMPYCSGFSVLNNIIVNNQGQGIVITESTADFNDIWNNSSENVNGPHGISLDPEFIDAPNHNFGLRAYSPCIDAGHPDAQYNDPDGSRNDMGALPFGNYHDDETIVATPEWINVYCASPTIEGVPLAPGDIIKAYDPEGVLCGIDTVRPDGAYGFMPVYRDDPDTPFDEGAEPGDKILFKVADQLVRTTPEVYWMGNGDRIELCTFNTTTTVTIELSEGWNLVSWPLDTEGKTIGEVLENILPKVDLVQSFELTGLTYDPLLPDFSTLEFSDNLHGYWIKMFDADALTIQGTIVNPSIPIYLERGWNLVSYLPATPLETPTAVASIYSNLHLILGYEQGEPGTYNPDLPDFSTLSFLKPGLGYWIKVNKDEILSYPGLGQTPGMRSLRSLAATSAETDYHPSRYWIDLYSGELILDGRAVPAGTSVRAVDVEGHTVGDGTVGDGGRFGFMPVYGDDPGTDDDEGLNVGETFYLEIDGTPTTDTWRWNPDQTRVELGELRSSGDAAIPKEFRLYDNFPNPFNPATTIKLALPENDRVSIDVFNILGRKVDELYDGPLQAGVHSFVWNGLDKDGKELPSGIYFYRVITTKHNESKKMLLLK